MKYILMDLFNDRVVSRHLSMHTAVANKLKQEAYWKRHGNGAYIPYGIRNADGSVLSEGDSADAGIIEYNIACSR